MKRLLALLSRSWNWISNPTNQNTLKFVGAGAAIVVAGVWKAFFSAHEPPSVAAHDCNVIGSTVNGTVNQNCHTINQAVREPNGLYQGDNRIGTVSSQHDIDDANMTITFRQVALISGFVESEVVYYQNLLLKCQNNSVSIRSDAMTGGSVSFPNFRCSIVGISPSEK